MNFEVLVQSLPDGVLVAEDEGVIVFVNARLEEISRYGAKDLIGQPVEVLFPGLSLPGSRAPLDSGHQPDPRDGGLRGGRQAMRTKDGSAIPVEIELSTLLGQGKVLSVAVVRRLTEGEPPTGRRGARTANRS